MVVQPSAVDPPCCGRQGVLNKSKLNGIEMDDELDIGLRIIAVSALTAKLVHDTSERAEYGVITAKILCCDQATTRQISGINILTPETKLARPASIE